MPTLQRPDGEIYYEEFGSGFPILLFAPGGLRSRLEMWHHPAGGPRRTWCDWTDVLAAQYRVVAMDQRNAGRSKCAIEADHGWHTYAADHIALMDHLGHQKFHVLGGCIGGSFLFEGSPGGAGSRDVGGVAEPDRRASGPSRILSGKPRRMERGAACRAAGPERSGDPRVRPEHVGRRFRVLRGPGLRSALPGADDAFARHGYSAPGGDQR